MQLHDGIGILRSDFLDVDTSLGRQHEEVLLGRTIECERGVVLLGDVAGMFHPQALHHVTLDVHAENVVGMESGFLGVVCQLDAAGLATTTDLHLSLDHHGVAGLVGHLHGLVDGVGGSTGADRNVVTGEVLLALVLEQVHVLVSS